MTSKNVPFANVGPKDAFNHLLKVGDILVSSWGYSMIIVDFYKVIKVMPKMIEYVRIDEKDMVSTGFLCGTVMPDPDRERERTDYVVISASGAKGPIKVRDTYRRRTMLQYNLLDDGREHAVTVVKNHCSTHAVATLWNGKPVYFNHCD